MPSHSRAPKRFSRMAGDNERLDKVGLCTVWIQKQACKSGEILKHMATRQNYGLLSGIRRVLIDYCELT